MRQRTAPGGRYKFGLASGLNVLNNPTGGATSLSIASGHPAFTLGSFYATPVYVSVLELRLVGTKAGGAKVLKTIQIKNPDRTLVRSILCPT